MKKIDISLKIEFILLIIITISLISSFITKNYSYSKIIMGIILLVMAYNNHKHFKRKYLTALYTVFGTLVIISTLIQLIYG